jgi:myo-inositol-1(or 4)-monophosphatase
MTDLRRLFEDADAVAVRAAELLLRMQRQDIGLTRKERLDVVTAADLASEKLVVAGLRALTPDTAILSEERERADRRTALDRRPLDRTVNYAAGLP